MEEKQNRQEAKPTAQPNAKLRSKPAKALKEKKASTGRRWTHTDYASHGVEPDKVKALLKIVSEIVSIGRRTTEQTFTLGEQLHIAAGLIEERTFGKWVSAECKVSRQRATTWINIATRLQHHKERMINIGIPATTMGVLAANMDCVENVLGEYETGLWLTGDDVRAIAGVGNAKPKTTTELANTGGIAGLRNLAKAKADMGIGEFAERLTVMIRDIEEALKPAEQGKRVLKGVLAKKIEGSARFARAELKNIALFIEPNELNSTAPHIMKFPEGSKWWDLAQLLYDLGGQAQWNPDMVPWLSDHVVPLLKWAISKEKQAATVAS
ncbi:hypothetical protein [Mesorhizobium sp. A556]